MHNGDNMTKPDMVHVMIIIMCEICLAGLASYSYMHTYMTTVPTIIAEILKGVTSIT